MLDRAGGTLRIRPPTPPRSPFCRQAFIKEAYRLFQHENALNPTAFPSLRKVGSRPPP